jgi:hypothetical protein
MVAHNEDHRYGFAESLDCFQAERVELFLGLQVVEVLVAHEVGPAEAVGLDRLALAC